MSVFNHKQEKELSFVEALQLMRLGYCIKAEDCPDWYYKLVMFSNNGLIDENGIRMGNVHVFNGDGQRLYSSDHQPWTVAEQLSSGYDKLPIEDWMVLPYSNAELLGFLSSKKIYLANV